MEAFIPYIASIVSALLSGIVSYTTATKKLRSEMEALKVSNQHEIERLVKQHEINLEDMEKSHQLELERIRVEHGHQMELASAAVQNEVAGSLLTGMFGTLMSSPEVSKQMTEAVCAGMKKGN